MMGVFANPLFRKFAMTFTLPSAAGTTATNPATGLEYDVPSDLSTIIVCTLEADRGLASALRYGQPGVDELAVRLTGNLVEPMIYPAGVRPGMVARLEWNGTNGSFTLDAAWPELVPMLDGIIGQPISGTWRGVQ